MARRYQSADVPDFSTYPASPEPVLDHAELPPAKAASPELDEAARKIGGALGRAVSTVRSKADKAGERLRETSEEVQEKVQQIRQRSATAGGREDLRHQAKAKAQELGSEARVRLDQFRGQARIYIRENPFKVILAGGVVGVLLGAALRFSVGRRS
jgi:ElaB/YqjD/DUF883 family membrane-anchored ribosome-binding protein